LGKRKFNSLPESSLNNGNNNLRNHPSIARKIVSISASVRIEIPVISCFPPITCEHPLPLHDRRSANGKCCKMMQAISNTPPAMPINIQIVFGSTVQQLRLQFRIGMHVTNWL